MVAEGFDEDMGGLEGIAAVLVDLVLFEVAGGLLDFEGGEEICHGQFKINNLIDSHL